jgi:cytochrome P450 family 4 subfamily V
VTNSVNIGKNFIYNFLHAWLGTGLLTSTGAKWSSRRRMLTPTFHFKILEEYVPLMNKHADNLVKKLEKFADGRRFDISNDLGLSTLEVICDTAMGYGSFNDGNSDYVKAIKVASEGVIYRIVRPLVWKDFIFNRTKLGKEFQEAVKLMHRFTDKIINERRTELKAKGSSKEVQESGKKRHRSFLDLLLETSEDGKSLTNEDIREEVDTFVFEGHDTTAMGLNWTTYLLGHNPEIQERLQEELDAVLEDGQEVTSEDLKELKYLERVIKEAQRLYPSVPIFGREIIQDVKVGEYTIPKGASTIVLTYALHRNPDVFPDPEKFDPDRFLPENSQGRSPFAYIPFSAGQRNCIGQKFAMTELKMTLAKLFHKYNIKSLTSRDEMKIQGDLVLRPVNGIQVNLTKRN